MVDANGNRSSRFLSLPKSAIGRRSASLLVLTLVLLVANAALVAPMTERSGGLEAVGNAYNWVTAAILIAAGVTAVIAMIGQRERSWVLFAAAVISVVLMGAEVVDLIIPG